MNAGRPIAVFLCFLILSGMLAGARPSITAQFTERAPDLALLLDDPVWELATPGTGFAQLEPRQGAEPSEATEIRILYDRDHVYVGVRCYDSDPLAIRSSAGSRDADPESDDVVYLALDTFGRGQEGYFFFLTPGGAKGDGQIQSSTDRELNTEWDGIWSGRAAVDTKGWSAVFALPTRSLSFDSGQLVWRVNVERVVRRKQERIRWAGAVQGRPLAAMADFGEVRGLNDLRQGRGITVTPYFRMGYRRGDGDDFSFKAGMEAVYQITPALAASLTVNTDFAEAEVDDRIVNLTRFPISLPEKRAFFLQDAPLFTFGGINYVPYPYFSRRIGLSPTGEPIDILGGLKVTGRVGSFSLGALTVLQDSWENLEQKNLTVGRFAYLWGENSSAGILLTAGDPRHNGDNRALGLDFNHIFRVFGGRQRASINSWVVATDSDARNARDGGAALQLKLEGEPWSGQLFYMYLGEDYDPGLGFVSRRGIIEYYASVRNHWRPEKWGIRSIETRIQGDYYTDLQNNLENWNFLVPRITILTEAEDEVRLEVYHQREVLQTPFEIRPNVVIPTDDYSWFGSGLRIRSSRARPLSVDTGLEVSRFYGGQRTDLSFGLGWRVRPGMRTGVTAEWRQVRLPGGAFDVWLGQGSANFSFRPDLNLNLLAQYDNLSRSIGMNGRLRWTVKPGSDVFLVVNQGWIAGDGRLADEGTDISAKGGWSFRF